jgi:hypothetical protein
MENKKSCITNCYNILTDKAGHNFILHPFLSIISKKNSGVCGIDDYALNSVFMVCDSKTPYSNEPINSFKNPINPEDYLSSYFGLKNMDDIINYMKKNDDLLVQSKSRILDLTYIKYKDAIETDIIKWIELIKVLFKNDEIEDKTIVKILKTINKKYDLNKKNYPFNLQLKIKKFLAYNI